MAFMVGGWTVKALILCGLLYAFARHEADFDYQKVLMVTAGIVLGATLIEGFLGPWIKWFTCIPVLALMVALLMKFCWVSLGKAILVAAIFTTLNTGLNVGAAMLSASMAKGTGRALAGTVDPKDMKEAQEALESLRCTVGRQTACRTVPEEPSSFAAPAVTTATTQTTQCSQVPTQSVAPAARPAPQAAPVVSQAGVATAVVMPPDAWAKARTNLSVEGQMSDGNGARIVMEGWMVCWTTESTPFPGIGK